LLVGEITEREAQRNRSKTAIVEAGTGRRTTYSDLHRRVDGFSNGIATSPSWKRGDRIGLLSLNTIESFEIYLGAARSGSVAQGLNWRLAPEELARIVEDAQPYAVVCAQEFAELGYELQRRVDVPLWLFFGEGSDGSYEDFVAAGGLLQRVHDVGSLDEPLLILYTGGTTGESKGAVHTNRSCLAAMVNNTVAERVVPTDRYLLLGQMFHSSAVLALNYLSHGATVVLIPKFEPRLTLEAIETERVTASLAFPAMMNYLLTEADSFDLTSLRNVQYGGGPMAPRVIRSMAETLRCGLIQCYGSTEHVGVTFLSQEDHRDAIANGDERRLTSCGREAHLTRVRLIDATGNAVPRDGKTPGEIVVLSPSNMIGYWRRPDLTAKAMYGEWLGTGDLAVWDDDGYIYVVDRAKDMVISGGENIYPAQVEKAIAEHPAVLEVAVVGEPEEFWGEIVTAFVVLHEGRNASVAEIQQAVTERLGSYQKPRKVQFLSELPKSSSGKVAKHLLADLPNPGLGAVRRSPVE
jgi:acyl-CoA synthetase (AMP-forming)/AMP-acid ligase II